MKLLTIAALITLASCTITQSPSAIEDELKAVLLASFKNENTFPSERNIRQLRGHAWNLEMMLRATQMQKDQDLLEAVLKRYFSKYRNHLDQAKEGLESIAAETGCSKALLITLIRGTRGIEFEFFETRDHKLNPKYRYSRLILDERAMFPNSLPLAMSKVTPSSTKPEIRNNDTDSDSSSKLSW